jgi:hypothetical protein
MYPAIPLAERMAVRDMLIPLADPIPMSTRESMSHIHVRKGQVVSLGIASYHRLRGSPAPSLFRRAHASMQTGIALGRRRARVQPVPLAEWDDDHERCSGALRQSVCILSFIPE